MDVRLKFPYEDQVAENDLKDSVWEMLQSPPVMSSSNRTDGTVIRAGD